jgi:hypothetical protein
MESQIIWLSERGGGGEGEGHLRKMGYQKDLKGYGELGGQQPEKDKGQPWTIVFHFFHLQPARELLIVPDVMLNRPIPCIHSKSRPTTFKDWPQWLPSGVSCPTFGLTLSLGFRPQSRAGLFFSNSGYCGQSCVFFKFRIFKS